jgi:streptogramin lyase
MNTGAGAGGVSSGTSGSGSSSGGTVGAAGNGVMGTANAPSVTFTEYPIPTNTGAPDSNPGAMAAGPDGNLWFNHQSTAPNAIQSITPTGTFSGVFKTSTTNVGPVAVTGGPDSNVYYTKQGGIGQAQPSGAVKEFGVPNGGDSGGITNGPDGKVWFTEPGKNKIGNMTPAGQFTEFPIPTANSTPFAITLGPDKNLWFTESGSAGNKIGKITTAGVITEYPIATPAANAHSIVAGPDGNLWFTELDGHKLGKVTPAGVVTEYGLPSAASPGNIVAGKDGNLWFAEAGTANCMARATPAGSVAEYLIPSAAAEPAGVAAGADGNIWFSELGTNKIGRVSNLMGGGTVKATTGMGGGDAPLTNGMVCTNDTDCVGSGKACGGDVCSFKVTPHVCVLATSGDPGWCSADTKCWCNSEGATCDMTSHACSSTLHGGK